MKEAKVVTAAVAEKAEPAVKEAKAAVEKAKPAVKIRADSAKKKMKKTVQGTKAAVEKVLPKKTEMIIQSPMGGEITPEDILAKIGDADQVYIRVDVNKAYWVKGNEAGSVDLW